MHPAIARRPCTGREAAEPQVGSVPGAGSAGCVGTYVATTSLRRHATPRGSTAQHVAAPGSARSPGWPPAPSGARAGRSPSAAPTGCDHHRQEAPRSTGGARRTGPSPRGPRPSRAGCSVGVVPAPTRKARRKRSAASSTPRPRRPAADHLARVDGQLQRGEERDRPWCRSSGARAPASTPASDGDRADRRTPEALGGERPHGPRRGSAARGCRVAPGQRPRGAGALLMRARATDAGSHAEHGEVQRGRTRAPREVGLALGARRPRDGCRPRATTWPAKPPDGQVARGSLGRTARAATGHEVLVLGRARCRRSRCRCRSLAPSRSAISIGVGPAMAAWRQVEGDVVVGLVAPGPSRGGRPRARARAGPPGVHVLDGEGDAGRSSAAATPSTKSRGVVLLPPERRVHARRRRRRPRRASSVDRSSLPQGSVPQTRWVTSRHGACTAQTGMPWCSRERAQGATSAATARRSRP